MHAIKLLGGTEMGIIQFTTESQSTSYFLANRLGFILNDASFKLKYQTYINNMLFEPQLRWNTLLALCNRLCSGIGSFCGVSRTLDPTTALAYLIQQEFVKVYQSEKNVVVNINSVLPSFYNLASHILTNSEMKWRWRLCLRFSGTGSHAKRRRAMSQVFAEGLKKYDDVLSVKAKYNELVQYAFNIIAELERYSAVHVA